MKSNGKQVKVISQSGIPMLLPRMSKDAVDTLKSMKGAGKSDFLQTHIRQYDDVKNLLADGFEIKTICFINSEHPAKYVKPHWTRPKTANASHSTHCVGINNPSPSGKNMVVACDIRPESPTYGEILVMTKDVNITEVYKVTYYPN